MESTTQRPGAKATPTTDYHVLGLLICDWKLINDTVVVSIAAIVYQLQLRQELLIIDRYQAGE